MTTWFTILAAAGLDTEQRVDLLAPAEGAAASSLGVSSLHLVLALLAVVLLVCWIIVLIVRSRSQSTWSHPPPNAASPAPPMARASSSLAEGPLPMDTQWVASAGFIGRKMAARGLRSQAARAPRPVDELHRLRLQLAAGHAEISACQHRMNLLEKELATLRAELRHLKRTAARDAGATTPDPAQIQPFSR